MIQIRHFRVHTFLGTGVLALVLSARIAVAGLDNPGFETGDLTCWSFTGTDDRASVSTEDLQFPVYAERGIVVKPNHGEIGLIGC